MVHGSVKQVWRVACERTRPKRLDLSTNVRSVCHDAQHRRWCRQHTDAARGVQHWSDSVGSAGVR
eukprot:5326875-Alexandrium_andersonii.AAC.1